ncbi:MAG: glucose-1-phosphate thymidylyltransferase, partial [Proteobacteria bacterium]
LAVYDKPMIYYPLTVLIAAGVREFCLISTIQDQPNFQHLLGDGKKWGISIEYRAQPKPEGIAQAFIIAESFIGHDEVVLMLGDNIFSGGDDFPRAMNEFKGGATIFAYHVSDPERYGVVEFDREGNALSLEEKPSKPRSAYAVPGIYIYDNRVVEKAKALLPSERGELEITDINRQYLDEGKLHVRRLSRGFAWLDAGTSTALQEAASYIEAIERRQGIKIGCPEEAALVRNFLSFESFKVLLSNMPKCEYRDYLERISEEIMRAN